MPAATSAGDERAGFNILVLGIGNLLLADEGLGVHAIRYLADNYSFPDNVELIDGGTLGLLIMDRILAADRLLVIDALRGGEAPGSVYRLEAAGLRQSLAFSDSLHQLDLPEALTLHALSGAKVPQFTIFGLEPQSINELRPDLSPPCRAALPKLCGVVIEELRSLGCPITAL